MSKYIFVGILFSITFLFGCNKSGYFINEEGLSKSEYAGNILDYLKEKKAYFDTLSAIVEYAGMTSTFQTDTITFFAPPDSTIQRSISSLNRYLSSMGQTNISSFRQIRPETWRKLLSMYILRGKRKLDSFIQIDINNLLAFPGQYYNSINENLLNIGVVFTDLVSQSGNSIKYQGYRYLSVAFIPSEAAPLVGRAYAQVASSDIQPRNGVIHVLSINGFGSYTYAHSFGFDMNYFLNMVTNDGILY